MILLTFVAASDGDYDSAECDEVVKHVFDRFPEEGLREDAVRRRVRAFVPDEHAFRRALSRLCAGSGDARAVMRSMRRVIDADGEVDPEEVAFAAEIGTALRTAGWL